MADGSMERIAAALEKMVALYQEGHAALLETQRQERLKLYYTEACEQCRYMVDGGWVPAAYFQGTIATRQACPVCHKNYVQGYRDGTRTW